MAGAPAARKAAHNKKPPRDHRGGFSITIVKRFSSVLGRPGSDLLFQVLRLSTIGAGEFNGRVRDGIGFRLPAKATKPAKDRGRMSEKQSDRTSAKQAVLSDICHPTS